MLTSRTARWVAGTTLLCVALLGLSWLLLVSPQRTEAAELRDQNAATQSQNDLLEVKIAQLRAQFAKLPESQAELASILAQMPPDAGMPRLVRDLDAMSESTGVTLSSVTPGPAVSVRSGTTVPGAAAAAPTAAATAAAAAGTAVDGSTVVAIPVTVAIDGDYFQTVAFLKQLQTQMPRAFLVTAVQMSAGSAGGADASATGGNVAVTITGKVFALPGMSADVLTTGTGTTGGAAGSPMSTATAGATPGASPAAAPTASAPAATATPAPTATATQEVS
ncbi:MAG: type 4a pilus biogenesis protein PilO [Actinobacteria bacterium]|nr:type 4a pilus biogenesis protein PilO [Actinomycetota bacterium]